MAYDTAKLFRKSSLSQVLLAGAAITFMFSLYFPHNNSFQSPAPTVLLHWQEFPSRSPSLCIFASIRSTLVIKSKGISWHLSYSEGLGKDKKDYKHLIFIFSSDTYFCAQSYFVIKVIKIYLCGFMRLLYFRSYSTCQINVLSY